MYFPLFLAEAILNQEIWILLRYMTFKTSLLVRKCSAIVLNEINLNVRLNYSQQSKSIEIFIVLQYFLSNKMDIIIFKKIKFPESGFSLTLATSQGSPQRSLGNRDTEMFIKTDLFQFFDVRTTHVDMFTSMFTPCSRLLVQKDTLFKMQVKLYTLFMTQGSESHTLFGHTCPFSPNKWLPHPPHPPSKVFSNLFSPMPSFFSSWQPRHNKWKVKLSDQSSL